MIPANDDSKPPDWPLSAQAKRGMHPGPSLLATMFTTHVMPPYTLRDPQLEKRVGCKLPTWFSSPKSKVWKVRTWLFA